LRKIAQNWDNLKLRETMNKMAIKGLGWIASSKTDLMQFPLEVRKEMGHALYIAQQGGKHKDAKPLNGFGGSSVLEIVKNDGNGTFRTVYTVQFKEVIYVLHAFQKKSKVGIKTPKQEIDLIEKRLGAAQQIHKEWLTSQKKRGTKNG
jgi:phage-related protein